MSAVILVDLTAAPSVWEQAIFPFSLNILFIGHPFYLSTAVLLLYGLEGLQFNDSHAWVSLKLDIKTKN
jgi:hypothetical protein